MNNTFCIYNLGCKVNQEEGGALAGLFLAQGWRQGEPGQAGLIVINTCTVTRIADKKDRNLIRRLRRDYPAAILAVCGCYVQRDAEAVQALGADILCGVDDRAHLPELVAQYRAEGRPLRAVGDIRQAGSFRRIGPGSRQERARAYLKVEDGCDQFCHYCIIPHVRGPVRSLPLTEAVAQAQDLIASGHQELVLSGIHIGAYGQDLPPGQDLPALIGAICGLPGLLRLRLGSLEPHQFSRDLLHTLEREPKLCPHLHIPLQSGCDRTLTAMGRRYTAADYARLLRDLRQRLGDPAITSDVMVGYPGESQADFAASRDFCQEMGFAALHVFPYSRREGTPAAQAPGQLPQAVKAERAGELTAAGEAMTQAYISRYLGQTLTLLAEEIEDGYSKGHSGNYIMLYLPGGDLQPGAAREVRATALFRQGLLVETLS